MDQVNIGLIGTGDFAHKVHFLVPTEKGFAGFSDTKK